MKDKSFGIDFIEELKQAGREGLMIAEGKLEAHTFDELLEQL